MELRIIGAGSASGTSDISTSFLINNTILFESPPAITNIAMANNVDLHAIDSIFISHLHGDHYFGLPFIILDYKIAKRKTDINIYGPEGLNKATKDLYELAFPGSNIDDILKDIHVNFIEISPQSTIDIENLAITPYLMNHTIETFGFTINDGIRSLFYSADTSYFSEMDAIIKKVDICLCDATTYSDALKGHMSYTQLCHLAAQYPKVMFYAMHRSNYLTNDHVQNIILP